MHININSCYTRMLALVTRSCRAQYSLLLINQLLTPLYNYCPLDDQEISNNNKDKKKKIIWEPVFNIFHFPFQCNEDNVWEIYHRLSCYSSFIFYYCIHYCYICVYDVYMHVVASLILFIFFFHYYLCLSIQERKKNNIRDDGHFVYPQE